MAEGGIDEDYDVFDPGDNMEERTPSHLSLRNELIKPKVRSFYESIGQEPPEVIDPNDFELKTGDHLFFKTGDDPVQLTTKPDPTKFLKKSTLKQRLSVNDQNRLGIRQPDPNLRGEGIAALQNIVDEIPNVNVIPLQDLSQSIDAVVEEVQETILDDEQTALKTLEVCELSIA